MQRLADLSETQLVETPGAAREAQTHVHGAGGGRGKRYDLAVGGDRARLAQRTGAQPRAVGTLNQHLDAGELAHHRPGAREGGDAPALDGGE